MAALLHSWPGFIEGLMGIVQKPKNHSHQPMIVNTRGLPYLPYAVHQSKEAPFRNIKCPTYSPGMNIKNFNCIVSVNQEQHSNLFKIPLEASG
jgi:hypothetical protein